MAETTLNDSQLLFIDSTTQGTLELSGGNMALDAANQLTMSGDTVLITNTDQDLELTTRLVFRTNGDTYTPLVDSDTLYLDIVNNASSKNCVINLYNGTNYTQSGISFITDTNTGSLSNDPTDLTMETNLDILLESTSDDIILEASTDLKFTTNQTYTWPDTAGTLFGETLQTTSSGTMAWTKDYRYFTWSVRNVVGSTEYFINPVYNAIAGGFGIPLYYYIYNTRYVDSIALLMDDQYLSGWTSGNTVIKLYISDSTTITLARTISFEEGDVVIPNSGNDPTGSSKDSGIYYATFTPITYTAGSYLAASVTTGVGAVMSGDIGLNIYYYY